MPTWTERAMSDVMVKPPGRAAADDGRSGCRQHRAGPEVHLRHDARSGLEPDALALVVAGLAIVQLLPPFPGVPAGRHLLGVPLIALGAVLAVAAYTEWVRNQRALRRGDPMPLSVMPWILAATITGIAIIAAVVLLVSALR